MKLQINVTREKVDYFIEILEKGIEGSKSKYKPFVKAQINRLYTFKKNCDDRMEERKMFTKILLEGKRSIPLSKVLDFNVSDYYHIIRVGDNVVISYKDRNLYKCNIYDLFDDGGYECKIFVNGDRKKVKIKLEYEETIGEE